MCYPAQCRLCLQASWLLSARLPIVSGNLQLPPTEQNPGCRTQNRSTMASVETSTIIQIPFVLPPAEGQDDADALADDRGPPYISLRRIRREI
ncbi:hypothetical protein CONLIGDRAFT_637748 [Coniochaeta ligniaria NRRL 30616]|uniref:Uncharacterized protein n=1 Tax=Coniochaeta ligniaria NRRL 30616 TaxID=1408157 RepID=A0A1J7I7C9_9PEZI|nr:hypothetical protein CONLIGDRAFT_637748 [Coniochaeta ligniaria NRRL 30616]